MGKLSRDKGARFEREVANMLAHIDPTAKRNVAECQEASVDIITKLPLAIQCKNLGKWSTTPHKVYIQARDGALKPDDLPVGVIRISNKSPDLAVLALADFIKILERLYGKTDQNNGTL
jgi:hypothetical protein